VSRTRRPRAPSRRSSRGSAALRETGRQNSGARASRSIQRKSAHSRPRAAAAFGLSKRTISTTLPSLLAPRPSAWAGLGPGRKTPQSGGSSGTSRCSRCPAPTRMPSGNERPCAGTRTSTCVCSLPQGWWCQRRPAGFWMTQHVTQLWHAHGPPVARQRALDCRPLRNVCVLEPNRSAATAHLGRTGA